MNGIHEDIGSVLSIIDMVLVLKMRGAFRMWCSSERCKMLFRRWGALLKDPRCFSEDGVLFWKMQDSFHEMWCSSERYTRCFSRKVVHALLKDMKVLFSGERVLFWKMYKVFFQEKSSNLQKDMRCLSRRFGALLEDLIAFYRRRGVIHPGDVVIFAKIVFDLTTCDLLYDDRLVCQNHPHR